MWLSNLWRRLLYSVRREHQTADLEEEMQLHIELRARKYGEHGLDGAQARLRAIRQFGDRLKLVEDSRNEWGFRWLDVTRQDLRFSTRSLRRAPWLTVVIVLTLAIVIAANTTIFSLLHAVLLRKLAIEKPDDVFAVWPMNGGHRAASFTYSSFQVLQASPGAPEMAAYRFGAARVVAGEQREDLYVDLVSGGFFDLLGVQPVAGRTINVSDYAGHTSVAVVSEPYALRYFQDTKAAIGETIKLNGEPFTIIGVMPASYNGVHIGRTFNLAVPLTTAADRGLSKPHYSLDLLVRTGSAPAARAALEPVFLSCCLTAPQPDVVEAADQADRIQPPEAPTGWSHDVPRTGPEPQLHFLNASRGLTWRISYRAEYQRVLIALFAGVSILLLIACANVATLLLARAAARQQEFATRLSLGVSRGRLAGQLLLESGMLALAGTALGVLLSRATYTLLLGALPPGSERLQEIIAWRISPALMAMTVCTIVSCTLLFGFWPARRAARTDLLTLLKGSRLLKWGGNWRADRLLLAAQLACTLVLVCTGGLFVATLRNLERFDGGYQGAQVLLARLDVEATAMESQVPLLQERILNEVRRLPGVRGAVFAMTAPVINDLVMSTWFNVPGYDPGRAVRRRPDGLYELDGRYIPIGAEYFSVTGVGLLRGREFGKQDVAGSEPVAIVNQAFVREYFPGRAALGATILADNFRAPVQRRIIGIAREASYDNLRDPPRPTWYVPLAQAGRASTSPYFLLTVRTTDDPMKLAPAVRGIIEREAPGARIRRLTDVEQLMNELLVRERLAALVGFLFGAVALLLSAIGVYGLLSYQTARRTQEIGVRMALGARASHTLWLVLRQTLAISAIALAIGLPVAIALGFLIRVQLFGVGVADPFVLALSIAGLITVGLVASLQPTLRATRIDPAIALRSE